LSARLRFLFAAVIVAVVALGGAAYVNRASAHDDTAMMHAGVRLAGLDLSALSGAGGNQNDRMLAQAYAYMQNAYYRPVSDQTLLTGEQRALLEYLKAKKVRNVQLPDPVASGDRSHDLTLAEAQLAAASKSYGSAGTPQQFAEVAMAGMLHSVRDPYTVYLSPLEIRGLEEELQGGAFGGIGVYIVQDPRSGAILVDPIDGNPAIKAGVRPGDTILAVDETSVLGMKLDAVESRIRGALGSVVALKVRHPHSDAVETLHITRAEVRVPSVRAKMEDGIDYVRLADFGTTSADEVRKAFLDGKAQHAKGYILDLRNNGGGLLDAAVDISSLVIPSGTIVATINRAGDRSPSYATGKTVTSTPLVILVNQNTASASEITTGAIQDYKAGTIVGTRTFGKGVVQSLYDLPDGGALKITTARYVTPAGRDIQHRGIVPDVTVPQRVDLPIDTPSDKQLAVAKAIIEKKDHQ
jgi:carboxyl-terminal processing protease